LHLLDGDTDVQCQLIVNVGHGLSGQFTAPAEGTSRAVETRSTSTSSPVETWLINFTEEAKSRIYDGFGRALRSGGLLFVGGSER